MEDELLREKVQLEVEEIVLRKKEIKESRAALQGAAERKSKYLARLAELGISFQIGGDENHGRR